MLELSIGFRRERVPRNFSVCQHSQRKLCETDRSRLFEEAGVLQKRKTPAFFVFS